MKKNMLKRIIVSMFCVLFLVNTCFVTQAEEEKIIPSTVDYNITFEDSSLIFIGNEKPVEWKVGKKYFLTYTVSEQVKDETKQSGLLITTDWEKAYPYEYGGMYFTNKSLISKPGYTYFFRFEVTETGLKYVVIEAKGSESGYLRFSEEVGDLNTKSPYFGIWMAEGAFSDTLTHVRCYDENGTDLGICAPNAAAVHGGESSGVSNGVNISEMSPMEGINHNYSFSLKEAACVAFGNARKTDSDVIFLEYTVKNVQARDVSQSGTIMTSAPKEQFPFGDGRGYIQCTLHTDDDTTKLLSEGARYLVRFERGDEKFSVAVKRTLKDGSVDYFGFNHQDGVYRKDFGYVEMWLGEACSVTADFTDVKCYDKVGKNLGVSTNTGAIVSHYGELEDYSQCEAVYYCEATGTFISLDDECNASKRAADTKNAVQGTYFINNAVLTLTIGEETEQYDYAYQFFTDSKQQRYIRMKESDVTFYSKLPGGEVIETVHVTAKDGYKVAKPLNPTGKGQSFLYWVTGDGKEYDFDSVVTESIDLYAVWDGNGTWNPVSAFAGNGSFKSIIITGISSLLMIGATATGICLITRRKKYDGNKEKKK